MNRRSAAAVAALLAMAALVPSAQDTNAQGNHSAIRTEPNPEAPPETAQFHFLVGEWEAKIHRQGRDGVEELGTAIWKIRYILDGFALQDEWITHPVDENRPATRGTMIRAFDKERGEWVISEFTTPRLRLNLMTAKAEGDTMVMRGEDPTEGGAALSRRVFHDITPDSFGWRREVSTDGGESWSLSYWMDVKRLK